MGMERGGSYGTFGGKQNFPQPSAPPIAGAFSGCAPQYPPVPGYPVLENYPGSNQGSGGYQGPGHCQGSGSYQGPGNCQGSGSCQSSGNYQAAQYPGPHNQTCFLHCHEVTCHHRRLPFCGLGFGWFLFMMGFFIAVFPWYIGAGIFLFVKHDLRERTGLLACTIAAFVLLFVGGVGFHVHMLHR